MAVYETPEAKPLAARSLFQRYEIRETSHLFLLFGATAPGLAATQYLCDRSCAQYVVQLVNGELLAGEIYM